MLKTGTCTGSEKLVLQRPFPRAVTFDTCHNGGSRPSTPENSGGQRSVCIRHALSRRLPLALLFPVAVVLRDCPRRTAPRSEEHTSELQSPCNLVCRLLLEKKKKQQSYTLVKITP